MTVSRLLFSQTDIEVSRFVAGFWRQNAWAMSDAQLQAYIEQLIELGVTTMDHAFVYKSETQFGRILKATPSLRDKIEIVSKFGIRAPDFGPLGATQTKHYDSSPEHLIAAVDNALSELHIDTLDVMLIHRPDYLMDIDALAETFSMLIDSGKLRAVGVSNFSASQFDMLQNACDFPLATNQIEMSPSCLAPLDNGVLDQCQKLKVNPMFWSCLGGGTILTGEDERSARVRKTLQAIAEELNADNIEQIIYAWVLALPSKPLPIIGSSKIERVASAIKAEKLTLNREQWYAILEASVGMCVA